MANEDYSDIIHLPYRGRKGGGLSMYKRAAQFAPFAALTGHDAAIRETARLTDSQIEPTPNRGTSELARLSTYNNKIMSEELSSLELPRCEGGRLISQLGDENNEILNRKLAILRDHLKDTPDVTITFFQPDEKKSGGSYETYTGNLRVIDDYEQNLIISDGNKIPLPSVLDIDSKLFDDEEV